MLDQIVSLPEIAGLWFVIACGLQFAAVLSEQAGAARKPEHIEGGGLGVAPFALAAATTVGPALLLIHGFFITQWAANETRIVVMGAPIAAVLGAILIGRIAGGASAPIANIGRALAIPLGIAALFVAIYATRESVLTLVELLSTGSAQIRPPGG